ncbi:MAG: MFS transporter [Clostridia bacterium]|nr:MFS transporter [Clostridia bacterium]
MKYNVRDLRKKLKSDWRVAPQGRYMPLREIAAVSLGGLGVKFITNTVVTMILSTGNVLIGNTIGIPPMPVYFMYLVSVLVNIPLTTLRARIVDYSRLKKGKYRPFVFLTAIPTALLGVGFVLMPYDRMSMAWKCAAVLTFNIGFQFFYYFLYDSNENLVNVLSPNTYERSDVYSVKSIVDSFAPSLTNIIIPLIAKAVTGEEKIYDMRVYRAVYPPILILGVLLSVFIYVGTQEKIVQPKDHRIQVRFTDTLRMVAKNKYFWIVSLASCLGFLEMSFFNVLGWMYNYQKVCSAGQYALITTINGNAAFWAMVFAPILIRKIGKKNLMLFSNVMNIFFIAMMYPVVRFAPTSRMIWIFLVCLLINNVVTQITLTLTPSINGDIRDYQQYISGERVDGIFAVVGLIGSVWNLATGSILPAIYDKAGLNAETAEALGYSSSNIYEILYNEQYFRRICGVLILASVIGATLNVVPFFFYDLTETKQQGMIAVLKVRAMLEDHASGNLTEQTLCEGMERIEAAEANAELCPVPLPARRKNRAAYKDAVKHNRQVEISGMVLRELRYFSQPQTQPFLERAEKLTQAGIEGFAQLMTESVQSAKALPKRTDDEKALRKEHIEIARCEAASLKLLAKHCPNGVKPFDESAFERLFAEEDAADAALTEAYAQKDRQRAAALKVQKKQIARSIKKLTAEFSQYNRMIKPYRDAEKLLQKKASFEQLDVLRAEYEKVRSE